MIAFTMWEMPGVFKSRTMNMLYVFINASRATREIPQTHIISIDTGAGEDMCLIGFTLLGLVCA